MNYAIIAAGEGSRLANEGVKHPKPLIPIQGVPLIERLVNIFMRNNADNISIIINEQQPQTLSLLEELQKNIPLNIVVKDTASSMHSLYALREHLHGKKFCLTTVDTLFDEKEFTGYIEAFEASEGRCMMGVTDYIDDEKPLYASIDEQMQITGFHDTAPDNARYISGGIYGLTPDTLDILERCIAEGQSRMRNFQRRLITEGIALQAYPFGKVIDIDHAADIEKAEKFLANK